jgi:hypothetical protein
MSLVSDDCRLRARNVALFVRWDEAVEARAIGRGEFGADDEEAFPRISEFDFWPRPDRLLVLYLLTLLVDCELAGRVLL